MTNDEYYAFVKNFMTATTKAPLVTGDSAGFSWQPCDCCSSKLGGDRTHSNYGEVCDDCVYFNEYGDLGCETPKDHDAA